MKRYLYLLLTTTLLLSLMTPPAMSQTNTAPTIVIPIKGMIERGLLYVIRRGVDQALNKNAAAIVFDMDTPGGRVDVTEEIIRTMSDLPDSIETYTYINKDALSAGALIAISTRHIYMAPTSRIGASALVSATGDIEEGDLKEKHVSALVALMRSAAEQNGHDPKLIEAMIRKDIEYKLDGETIIEEGRLLTLTNQDAARPIKRGDTEAPLLSEGTVESFDDLLAKLDLAKTPIHRIEITPAERVARFIELFSFLFLAGGLLGIYIEFKTPGFGIPGIAGMILLAIFFWGHHIAGLTGGVELAVFAIGLTLLALEIFVVPGFGVTGISGISLILASIFLAMVESYPGTDWFELPSVQIDGAFRNLGLALAMALAFGLIIARFLPKTNAFQRLMLTSELDHSHGVAASAPTDSLVGSHGKALTTLHPAGFGTFNGKRLNVVARGAYIEKGARIVVAETYGNRIVVDVDRATPSSSKNQEPGTYS